MKGTEIKLGYAPTRRSIFSAPDAIKYRGLTKEQLEIIAALKVAMRRLADQYGCNAVAIQCWNALQGELGIMPCAANSL